MKDKQMKSQDTGTAEQESAPAELPDVATPKQTADYVGSTVQALAQDRYLNRGLPYCRYGGRIRYLRQDVLHYMADNRVSPGTASPGPVNRD
jgi:hypothetical protein